MACRTRTKSAVTGLIGARIDVEYARCWRGGGVNRGVADPERAAPNIMDTTPENQAATFRNQDQVWPHRVIRRGDAVRPLPPHARSLADLTFEVGDVRLSVSDYMARRRTAGLLILKHGEIALERYGMGSGPESRWTELLDREVDDRDARRRRAPRWRDRQPGRSLRPLSAAAARLGLRGRHDPQCPADVLGRGLERGQRADGRSEVSA